VTRQRKARKGRIRVLLLAPSLAAVSGVSTHANMLLGSTLATDFDMCHFQVGSEGRREGPIRKAWRLAASPFALAGAMVRWRADIVHINTSMDQKAFWRDLVYLAVARLFGRTVINQVHGGARPQTFFAASRFLTWILRRMLVGSHAVTVLSEEELIAYRAFDPRINVHLVPNAIEVSGLTGGPRQVYDGPLRLVYVGRLVATKGLLDIVAAVALLESMGRTYTCKIAGSGRDEAEMREAAARVGLANRIVFLGPVFGEAKNRLWLESDVFIFPTWHPEGLPYSILEAMAAGCVPVTCPVSGIADVIQDAVNGVFVPSRNPEALAGVVARLDDDRHALASLAEAGRSRVNEHYTTQRLARDFRELYQKSLEYHI
jgi:glycosyltransferase involved in cell wall biosynthesis